MQERADAPSTDAAPVSAGGRIVALDALRGVAVLGILLMNVQSFAMPEAAYLNPTAYGDLGGANYAVWYGCHLLADQKFLAIFSMLFGAGLVLSTARARASGGPWERRHLRRMAGLAAVGLVHAYGLWSGDILFAYAVAGTAVVWAVGWPPGRQLAAGLALLAVPTLFSVLATAAATPADRAFLDDWLNPTRAAVADEVAAFRGGWVDQSRYRAPASLSMQTTGLVTFTLGRAGGLMLVGMALLRWGVLDGRRSGRFYATTLATGLIVGLPPIAWGVERNRAAGWDGFALFHVNYALNYWASVAVAVAWASATMLACRAGAMRPIVGPLAAAGRMALSNYLLTTVVCTTLFYGHGVGLFGRVNRVGQLGVTVAVWAVLLAFSVVWMRSFRFGPAEWAWRSWTYQRWQPLWRAVGDG